MEIDWRGIARSSRLVSGDQGDANLLLLKVEGEVTGDLLNALVPDAEEEGPANGDWFVTPQGWVLFIEGLEADVADWIVRLGRSLEEAGITGVLTGARTTTRPMWGRPIEALPSWRANITYRSSEEPLGQGGWAGDPLLLTSVVDHSVSWLAATAPHSASTLT